MGKSHLKEKLKRFGCFCTCTAWGKFSITMQYLNKKAWSFFVNFKDLKNGKYIVPKIFESQVQGIQKENKKFVGRQCDACGYMCK